MAELTKNDVAPDAASSGTAADASLVADPLAVRVRLAPESRQGDEPAMRIAPSPEPLHMTNPSIGRGPLGGMAMAPGPDAPGRVLAQRQLLVDGAVSSAALRSLGGGRHVLRADETTSRLVLEEEIRGEGGIRLREVIVDGFRFLVEIEAERRASLRERATRGRASGGGGGPLQVKAIIPGKVVAISVEVGDTVTAGQQLLVVEAMKMQNELRAPRDGTIERVGVSLGVNIEIGDLLVVIS